MARRYYTLVERINGRWSPEFGDYDKETVVYEKQDRRDHDIRASDLKIIVTGDKKIDVDAAITKLNSEYKSNPSKIEGIAAFKKDGSRVTMRDLTNYFHHITRGMPKVDLTKTVRAVKGKTVRATVYGIRVANANVRQAFTNYDDAVETAKKLALATGNRVVVFDKKTNIPLRETGEYKGGRFVANPKKGHRIEPSRKYFTEKSYKEAVNRRDASMIQDKSKYRWKVDPRSDKLPMSYEVTRTAALKRKKQFEKEYPGYEGAWSIHQLY